MQSGSFMPIGEIVDERSLVNSIVALHATGGSTNHTLHMPAIAQAAGIQLTWQDMADLSEVVPTLSHVYPNGKADINHFQAAGGMSFLIRELLAAGLLHENVNTVAGYGLSRYTKEPFLEDGKLVWREGRWTAWMKTSCARWRVRSRLKAVCGSWKATWVAVS